jgi:hypothetical protein
MTLQPAVAPSESPLPSRQTAVNNWLMKFDALAAIPTTQPLPHWANRVVLFGLFLFTLAIPHSIFAANFGLNLSLLAWIIRGVTLRNFYFRRTPLDRPLLWFAGLTLLSAIFSIEPAVSLPKLKSLLLFGVLYLFASNLKPSAAPWLLGVLLCSSLTGVGFSLFEKVYGRGMVIASLADNTPLTAQFPGDQVLPGDVIWMIAKQRVHSVTEAARIIRNHKDGEQLEVETLRAGDPLPVKLLVTPALKNSENPLGITTSGRTRRFRVSGFTRQFLTYAEQMQMLALLCYGCLLSALAHIRPRRWSTQALLFGVLLLLFSLTLAMTASRAVIAAFLFALTVVSLAVGGRRTQVAALILIVLLGGFSVYIISTARQAGVISFNDDSSARRLAYMRAGLKLIPQHPWLGVGQDAHKLHWQEWGFPGNYVTHMHSTPIQLALDRGLPALGCYVWLLATMLSLAWRDYRFRQITSSASSFGWPPGLQLGTFGALLGFSFSSLANYNFGDSEVLLLLLLLVGLLLMNHPPDVRDEPLPAT